MDINEKEEKRLLLQYFKLRLDTETQVYLKQLRVDELDQIMEALKDHQEMILSNINR
ncbi:hypothetical protein THOM_2560 [Trachipleistophora hominis]|uniref:Uncharacterized protein n=1 Tax=Trachipleistophora hominis TaxID=72359 RepID=L7JTY8_TRAHO|nr:hypothetical protein THOM_2560 [Trachipleistophora hominis]